MVDILKFILVILAVILLFGAAVFVHEFGHYWMALRRGMKVEAFAIGFGPKVFGWTRNGIEYSWRLIPAGGYVKLPQMITSEAIEGANEPGTAPLPPASPLSKILVAFAGPLMNVVFAFVLAGIIFVVGLPVPVNPSIIGYVDPESAEGKLGIRPGDVIVEVGGKSVKGWDEVHTTTALSRTNIISVTIERDGTRSTYQLTARQNEMLGLKVLNLDPRDHAEVIDVQPEGAAALAGLKAKDVIVSFAGMPISGREQLIKLIQKRPALESDIVVKRGEQRVTLKVTPKMDPATKYGRIGVTLGSNTTLVYRLQKPGPDPITQVVDVWDTMVSTFSALFHSKETGVGAKDLSGPVGILSVLATQVKTDYRLALKFLVMLNINLAVLNLLPIPVLDGGHIVLSLLEAIRRKPLSVRVVEYTTTVFAVALISFMLYVTFFDIRRFSLFKEMFKRDAQIEKEEKPALQNPPTPYPARP